MGSPLLAATRNMTEIANLLTPVFDLLQDEVVREKLEDSARVFFSNSNLTINLIPALIIGALGLLFLLPLPRATATLPEVTRPTTTRQSRTCSSRWPLSRRARQTCVAPSTTTTPSAKVPKRPTMSATAPRQEDNWLDPEDFCGLRTVFKTSTTHALENRGRGGEYNGTRTEGVAVLQH